MIVQDVHYKFLASSLLGFNLPAGYNDNPFISLFQLYLTRWVGNHQLCPEGFASLVKSDRFFKRSQPMQHDTWNLGTKLQGWSRDPTLHLIINHFIFDQRTAAEWLGWLKFLDSVLLCMVKSVYDTSWKYWISCAKVYASKDKGGFFYEAESDQEME